MNAPGPMLRRGRGGGAFTDLFIRRPVLAVVVALLIAVAGIQAIWTDNYARSKLVPSLKDSLAKLRTDHVDLTLIHWPSPGNAVPVAEFMGALAEARAQGLTKHIGVSNFNIALMKEAIAAVGAQNIATNQIELHPYLQNRKVAEFAKSAGIHITSYMTLAYGKVINDPVIEAIAKAHGAATAQVVLAWAMQLGYAVIP